MLNKIFKNGIKFKCQGSSNCCVSHGQNGFVYLSLKDTKKIAKHLNLDIDKFKKKYCDYTDGYLHLKEIKKNGECRFLKNKKCTIYKSRPIQCRTWPFWRENMNAKEWNNNIINFCPGIGKGKKINFSKILKKINQDINNEKDIINEKK